MKSLATGVAAVAVIGAAAAGVTSLASVAPPTPEVQPVVIGAPVPLQPGVDVPTPDQLISILNGLQDPSVPFASKGNLVEGGIGPVEGRVADRQLQKAAQRGQLPLSFNVSNIQPAGPGAATANVNVTGPKLAGVNEMVTFVDQGGWKLSRSSAMSLLQAAQAPG